MLGVEYTRDTTAGTILRYNCFSSFTYSTHFYIFRHPQSHRLNSGNSIRASGSSECLTFQFSWLFSFSGIWNLLPCCVSIILICQTIIAYFVSTWIILWIFIYFKSFIDFVLDIMRSCYLVPILFPEILGMLHFLAINIMKYTDACWEMYIEYTVVYIQSTIYEAGLQFYWKTKIFLETNLFTVFIFVYSWIALRTEIKDFDRRLWSKL